MPKSPDIMKDLMRVIQLHRMFHYHHHHGDPCAGHDAGCPRLHPSQYPILGFIGSHEGCTQADIAHNISIKPSTVAISVRRLEKAGHVRRERDESDRRIWRVYLTEASKALKKRMQADISQEMDTMLQGFSPEDIERLHGYLKRIQTNLKKSIDIQETTQ